MGVDNVTVSAADRALVDKLETVWQSIEDLCSSLSEEEWKRPTDCPGWSVQDNLSHIVGTESMLLGRPVPEHLPADVSHVKNQIGEANEVQVDFRRSWPGSRVLDEFREVTAERLEQLRSWGEAEFSADSWTPIGPGQARDFLQIRIFDCWVHEQDMRRALRRPGHHSGAVAEHSLERLQQAMPYVIGKKAEVPEGTTVVFDLEGETRARFAVGVQGGRGRLLGEVPDSPTVTLRMDLEALTRLGCGRGDPEVVAEEVEVEGDADLGGHILGRMGFMI